MKLERSFYEQDVLMVAPELIGKSLVRNSPEGYDEYLITEVEAYKGTEDEASHARFGMTSRNAVMFDRGGLVYVYFIYGMYWMINVVTGKKGIPQAVLVRGVKGISGPGKVAGILSIDRSFYGEDLTTSNRIWIEDCNYTPSITSLPRHGINYASEPWKSKPWRYTMVQPLQNV